MSRTIPDWIRREFEQGYTPGDEPPGIEESYYRQWKEETAVPCPTCNQTMQNLGVDPPPEHPTRRVFWCPNCGTLKMNQRDHETVELPRNLRSIIRGAELSPPAANQYQSNTVKADFDVTQEFTGPVKVRLHFVNGRIA